MKKIIRLILLSLCCFTALTVSATQPMPMIVDTDMAVDDILALTYLLRDPAVQIKAIIVDGTGAGNCHAGFRHLQGLLKIAGRSDIPVACGAEQALGKAHHFPRAIAQGVDRLPGVVFAKTSAKMIPHNGVALLVKTLQESPQPVTLLTIGSLTNVALALQQQPQIKSKIARLYMMGGAVNVPGNIRDADPKSENRRAEWNLYFDPTAAQQVFAAGLPIYLVALDATQHAPMTMAFYHRVQGEAAQITATASTRLIAQALQLYQDGIEHGTLYFWDPLAAAIAVQPTLCRWQTYRLSAQVAPENAEGALAVDAKGQPVSVCHLRNTAPGEVMALF